MRLSGSCLNRLSILESGTAVAFPDLAKVDSDRHEDRGSGRSIMLYTNLHSEVGADVWCVKGYPKTRLGLDVTGLIFGP